MLFMFTGEETYENQVKFGTETFQELEHLDEEGYSFQGIHHKVNVICCCDWKARACLEGLYKIY